MFISDGRDEDLRIPHCAVLAAVGGGHDGDGLDRRRLPSCRAGAPRGQRRVPGLMGVMREAPAQFEAAVAKVMHLLGVEKPAADLGPAFMVVAQAVGRWMLLRVMVCRMEKADDLPARTMILDGVDHTLREIQGWLRRVAAGLTAWEKDP